MLDAANEKIAIASRLASEISKELEDGIEILSGQDFLDLEGQAERLKNLIAQGRQIEYGS